jgi:hypothetical protein
MLRIIASLLIVVFAAGAVFAAEDVTYTGEFLSGRVAIGGETSGFALRYRSADGATRTIDLDVKPDVARQFKSGARVRVTGTVQQREYVERGKVDVLVVKDIVAATD